jgi:hypothetical protein
VAVSEGRSAAPVLSLILCSRNDDYQRGAMWRLQTGLNLTARTVHALGLQDSVEILLTDWGGDEPIRDALRLTPEAAALLSIIEVPRSVAEKYQRDAPFSEVHALNAAARRARGEYIGRIDQDTILGRGFFERFFELVEEGKVGEVPLESAAMLSNRRGVPFRFASRRPPPMAVERFLRAFGRRIPQSMPLPEERYYQSYVGIWLIHRDLWFEIGGYDESFIYINWMEADMILRLEPKVPFVNLGRVVDHQIFHLNHVHPFSGWGAKGRVRRENPVRDHEHMPPDMRPNSADWGLANEDLAVCKYSMKPGEEADARASFESGGWGSFGVHTTLFGTRVLLDRAALALIWMLMAGPRLALRMAPGLREPWAAYRDAVRGHSLSEWPRRMLELRRGRRAEPAS